MALPAPRDQLVLLVAQEHLVLLARKDYMDLMVPKVPLARLGQLEVQVVRVALEEQALLAQPVPLAQTPMCRSLTLLVMVPGISQPMPRLFMLFVLVPVLVGVVVPVCLVPLVNWLVAEEVAVVPVPTHGLMPPTFLPQLLLLFRLLVELAAQEAVRPRVLPALLVVILFLAPVLPAPI